MLVLVVLAEASLPGVLPVVFFKVVGGVVGAVSPFAGSGA